MICLINLNTIQAPYIVLFVNVKTFRLYSQNEIHKQLVCLHRRVLQRKFQPYHVPLTTPLDSPLLHPVLPQDAIRKIVLPKDDIRNRQLLISFLPDCHNSPPVSSLRLLKLMTMTLTLLYQTIDQPMIYIRQSIVRNLHLLTKMTAVPNPSTWTNLLHLI